MQLTALYLKTNVQLHRAYHLHIYLVIPTSENTFLLLLIMQRKCRGHPLLNSKQTTIFCNDPHSELEFYKECKLIYTVNKKDLCDLLTKNTLFHSSGIGKKVFSGLFHYLKIDHFYLFLNDTIFGKFR